MEEPNTIESSRCAGCSNDISDGDYVSALNQDWHQDCFRCSVCDGQLSKWYFEKGGLLFCQNDYWASYGESCQQCAQVITGPVMAAGDHRFHPECFACVACAAHIEDGESYALVERSNLYCGSCFTKVRSASHSIRVVEVPPATIRVGHTSPTTLTVTEIDSSCGMLTLHIGDKILEINGAPVRNKPLDEIERALNRHDGVIQLTIEHSPESNTKRAQSNTQTQANTNKHTGVDDEKSKPELSPVERKINNKEDLNQNKHSNVDVKEKKYIEGRKERLFKRKGEDGGKWVNKRRQTPSSPLLGEKERSSSMSKLLDAVDGDEEPSGVLCDLSRARSFRVEPPPGQKVFRACDLLQGELLGSGFFGEVYKVTHRDTNEVMVLKQLYRVDEDAQRNFLKEVAVLRSLKHPNVLRFVGVLYKDKRLHLVTEYVAGGTLHHLIQDTSVSLTWRDRARLARDVSAGVGYLHRMNVIHRDLNSHNCLVREDKTVIVADFGLARIVQRTASSSLERRASHNTLRRKRYTVVGNPYWMAPEMMNGNVYDEKVDVFSFGIILCEIIGRVSADPDFLPRRSDFGLNEALFTDKFCRASGCPEPFYKIAFLACHLEPDARPPFEVIEIWFESLVMHLSKPGPLPPTLLADIVQYGRGSTAHTDSPDCQECTCHRLSKADSSELNVPETGVIKSSSNVTLCVPERGWRALGKCVSASHIGAGARPGGAPPLSRSHHALHTAGYILRADGNTINITKVDDISEWLDPLPLKRTSPDTHLNKLQEQTKTRKVESPDEYDGHLPSFLRNQSVEGLESEYKHEVDPPLPFCRHDSIPNSAETKYEQNEDSDSSDDDLDIITWHETVKISDKMDVNPKTIVPNIIKKVDNLNLLPKKASYDVADVELRNVNCLGNERKIPDVDYRRYNIDHLTKSPIMAEGVKNIVKNIEKEKSQEKSGFFPKKLLSPKFSRLFKPNTAEVVRNKDAEDKDKSRSKFFVQRPASPSNIRSYRIRPTDTNKPVLNNEVLKSDIKLASMGKPMTPIFRRHVTEKPEFADGRFSYRDKKAKPEDPKFIDMGRNRIKTPIIDKPSKLDGGIPLIRSNQINNVPSLVPEKKLGKNEGLPKKREPGISRSNYVSLANLKINGKGKESVNEESPVERVI